MFLEFCEELIIEIELMYMLTNDKTIRKVSIKYWQYKVNEDYDNFKILEKKFPILVCNPTLFCEHLIIKDCEGCPLNIGRQVEGIKPCYQQNHHYFKWITNQNKNNALIFLNFLKKKLK